MSRSGMFAGLWEQRWTLKNPPSWLLRQGMGGTTSLAGPGVTVDTAMQTTAVNACVRILAESVSSLPFILYRRTADGSKFKAVGHPLYSLLHDAPNGDMTSLEMRDMMMVDVVTRGNAFCRILSGRRGDVEELRPLEARFMEMRRYNGAYWYIYHDPIEGMQTFNQYEIWHVRGLTSNGLWGMSMIKMAANAIGLSLATEEYGSRYFSNGGQPGVVMKYPHKIGTLSDTAKRNIQDSWEAMHGGLEHSHRPAILEEGLTVEKLGVPPEEAQFLETRKFQVSEIARIFRVPPHMLADLERATFSNIEHMGLEFVEYSLRSWLVRFEQSMARCLLLPDERK
ncbi:MAG TPA: phage portal protein, partial [Anaerolineaceae bacterium]|nr:phage portal protein [Anaerolineaceae bacterium]